MRKYLPAGLALFLVGLLVLPSAAQAKNDEANSAGGTVVKVGAHPRRVRPGGLVRIGGSVQNRFRSPDKVVVVVQARIKDGVHRINTHTFRLKPLQRKRFTDRFRVPRNLKPGAVIVIEAVARSENGGHDRDAVKVVVGRRPKNEEAP